MKNINIIGITGYAQSGKDEVAKILKKFGYTRIALADALKEGLYNINPYVRSYHQLSIYDKFVKLQDLVDTLGWDEAKKNEDVRDLLQRYGTEGGRNIFGEDIWINIIEKKIRDHNVSKIVIPDIRFINEVNWVLNQENSLLIKIIRPRVGSINGHISDKGIDDDLCDILLYNDGTIEDLEEVIPSIFED